jgi:hypothetical protein
LGRVRTKPPPALRLLAEAQANAAPQTDGQPDAATDNAPEAEPDSPAGFSPDTGPPQDTEGGDGSDDIEFDEDDLIFDDGDIQPNDDGEVNFPPDTVARLVEIAGKLATDAPPNRPTGAMGRASTSAANQNVTTLDDAKATASEAEKEFGKLMLSLFRCWERR